MGRNHVRVLSGMADTDLVGVVDADRARAESCAAPTDASAYDAVESMPDVDFAVVAAPTGAHHSVAMSLIERGVHVLVEKPLAATSDEAEELQAAADTAGVVLAVGHIERFNPAFHALHALVTDPRMASFERLSPFTPRVPDSVVMDLMVHDIDIALWLMQEYPKRIEAVGTSVFSASIDVASALLEFAGGRVVTLQASRATQDKVRRASVSEPDGFIVADAVLQAISVKRHTTGEFAVEDGSARYRQVSVVETPELDRRSEPLMLELLDFVGAIRAGCAPRVGGLDGVQAVRLAKEIELKISQH